MADELVGRCKLIRQIAEGAMGSVWLAHHLGLDAPVVVKLIKADVAKHPDARARFQREARIAAQMRSAHVVQVLDFGLTAAGEPYMVMELLQGETLRARLFSVGALSPAATGALLVQVCRAMTKAHEAGLVHRDLKPDNIFLVKDVDAEVAKVLDFGIVKVPDALAFDGVDPTTTGKLLGTPCYMSPEQAQGLSNIDFRSDLWSLGVLGYECLTGLRPFSKSLLGPLIRQITIEPIPVPSRSAPHAHLGPAIDAWMARALSRDPLGRFSSARELARSFEHVVATGAGGAGSAAGTSPVAKGAAVEGAVTVARGAPFAGRATLAGGAPVAGRATVAEGAPGSPDAPSGDATTLLDLSTPADTTGDLPARPTTPRQDE